MTNSLNITLNERMLSNIDKVAGLGTHHSFTDITRIALMQLALERKLVYKKIATGGIFEDTPKVLAELLSVIQDGEIIESSRTKDLSSTMKAEANKALVSFFDENNNSSLSRTSITSLLDIIDGGGIEILIRGASTFLLIKRYGKQNAFTSVQGASICDKEVNEILTLCQKNNHEESNIQEIFLLSMQDGELDLVATKNVTLPLVPSNYSPEVIESYQHIVSDSKIDNPCGRLSIIMGPPGMGKTYLIRALARDMNGIKVFIPPASSTQLVTPSFISFLARIKEDYAKDKPIIFIFEDADDCLVPRAIDNMPLITNLLNLGDGITGSMFDLRIIATSNAKTNKIEPALTRAGRLCRLIELERFTKEQATAVAKNLNPDKALPDQKSYSLAEVYSHVNGLVCTEQSTTIKEPVGFSRNAPKE